MASWLIRSGEYLVSAMLHATCVLVEESAAVESVLILAGLACCAGTETAEKTLY